MSTRQVCFDFEAIEFRKKRLFTADQIYQSATADLLKGIEEDRRFERKPCGIHQKELGTYFSMFANTPPDGGIIVVGIENDGTPTGCCKLNSKQVNSLEKTGYEQCSEARYECKQLIFEHSDGAEDFVILFRVFYRHDKVVMTNGGEAYIRRGDSRHKLTADEVKELQHDKGQVQFEQEPCTLDFPEEFDLDRIREWANRVRVVRKLSEDTDDKKILAIFNLGKVKDGHFTPNNACALLFSKNPTSVVPGCKIRFLRFEGEEMGTGDRFNQVKDEMLRGRVPELIVECERLLESQLRNFTRLRVDGKFYTELEYPKNAWYEAVVNACAHRSYALRNMPIFVRMFSDRLEVESPGAFPPMVTPANIFDSHYPRNPQLMEALWFLDFVKCANEGTKRMRNEMISRELPVPEFSQKEGNYLSVVVTLRNNVKQRKVWMDADAAGVIGATIFESLNEHERQVINYVAEFERISVSQAQRLTQLSWPAASKLLRGLALRRILELIRKSNVERDPGARFVLRKPKASK